MVEPNQPHPEIPGQASGAHGAISANTVNSELAPPETSLRPRPRPGSTVPRPRPRPACLDCETDECEQLKERAKQLEADMQEAESGTGTVGERYSAYTTAQRSLQQLMQEAWSKSPPCEVASTYETKAPAGRLGDYHDMVKDLPPGSQDIINQSPMLQDQILELSDQGYTMEMGPAGQGSFHNSAQKRIVIESGMSDEWTASVVAHEVGHGHYTQPYHPPEGLTRADYVRLNVDESLRNEAFARYNEIAFERDLIANGNGASVTSSWGNDHLNVLQGVQNGTLTESGAITQITNDFRGYTTSTSGQLYPDYYGDFYGGYYDQLMTDTHAP